MDDTAHVHDPPVLNLGDGNKAITRDDLQRLDAHTWPEYRKKVLTRAVRVTSPFKVATSEGVLSCSDGYLAVDARGYPYPIAATEFSMIYEEAPDGT